MSKCKKSYSEEHAFIPKDKGLICVLCNKYFNYELWGLK